MLNPIKMKKPSNLEKSNSKKLNKLVYFLAMLIILTEKAFAYIDPGTGGMVVGSLWPMILAILAVIGSFFVKIFYKPIKNIFLNLRKK